MGLTRYANELMNAGITIPYELSSQKKDLIEIGLDLRELRTEDILAIINAETIHDAQRILTTNRKNDVCCGLEPLREKDDIEEMEK